MFLTIGMRLQNKCGKPTPLGMGWIAKNIKIMCI